MSCPDIYYEIQSQCEQDIFNIGSETSYHTYSQFDQKDRVAVTRQCVTDSFYLWLLSKRKMLPLVHAACVTALISNVTLRLPSNTAWQLRCVSGDATHWIYGTHASEQLREHGSIKISNCVLAS